jgi:hypothetical protein
MTETVGTIYCQICNSQGMCTVCQYKMKNCKQCNSDTFISRKIMCVYCEHKIRQSDYSPWKPSLHADFTFLTNSLFSTLFLGIQRLEDTAGLPLAHQAMLEEMLECWTKSDDFLIWHRWMLDY